MSLSSVQDYLIINPNLINFNDFDKQNNYKETKTYKICLFHGRVVLFYLISQDLMEKLKKIKLLHLVVLITMIMHC